MITQVTNTCYKKYAYCSVVRISSSSSFITPKQHRIVQESRAVAREPRDATAVFGLKSADNIHYKFKSSQASNASLQSSKHTVCLSVRPWRLCTI